MNLQERDVELTAAKSISAADFSAAPQEPPSKGPLNWLCQRWLHVALLVAVTWLCFGKTLSTYFLADDFGEIQYVYRIFNGEPQLLLSNFVGNFMQIAGMNVWRPGLLMTLVFDYMLYGTKAWGWYLTNMLYFTGCVVLLYTVARQLTAQWSPQRSSATAFTTAAFFALNPLRCESVTWMVGRVDIVSCFYYLLSFALLLKAQSTGKKSHLIWSLLSFWVGLLTKEMAVGLPVIAAAVGFFFTQSHDGSASLKQRLTAAFQLSLPFVISLVLYFTLRVIFLGTLVGGYTAGFGASQLSFMVQRWLDPDTVHRLFFPFNYGLIKEPNIYSNLLAACYGTLAALVGYRLIAGQLPWRYLAFLFIWALTCIAPIFQLWGLGYNLEGSRFYWFVSMPLAMTLPVLLFSPADSGSDRRRVIDQRIIAVSSIALAVALFVLGKVALMTNALWVRAGKEVAQVATQAKALAAENPKQSYAILGIPKDRAGAHLILNGSTFNTMLNRPFVNERVDNRFITFDPIMFGPTEYINASRLKSALAQKDVLGPMLWSGKGKKFDAINIRAQSFGAAITMLPLSGASVAWQPHTLGGATYSFNSATARLDNVREGDGLLLSGLNINPLDYDFIEFDIKAKGIPHDASIKARWSGSPLPVSCDEQELTDGSLASQSLSESNDFQHVRIRLSHYWRWFVYPRIDQLALLPPPAQSVEIRSIQLTPAATLVPQLSLASLNEDNTGVYNLHAKELELKVDLPPGQTGGVGPVEIEIGKPNFFFDNFTFASSQSYVAQKISADANANVNTVNVNVNDSQFARLFPTPGYYQLRACKRSQSGEKIGEYSDAITIRIF